MAKIVQTNGGLPHHFRFALTGLRLAVLRLLLNMFSETGLAAYSQPCPLEICNRLAPSAGEDVRAPSSSTEALKDLLEIEVGTVRSPLSRTSSGHAGSAKLKFESDQRAANRDRQDLNLWTRSKPSVARFRPSAYSLKAFCL